MARPPQGNGGPPLSFKTIPGRNRTQKWNTAKTYDYSGDDWGGYDAYDDYAGHDQPNSAPAMAQPQSFGPQGSSQRTNSFDPADERRQFSAGPVMYGSQGRDSSPASNAYPMRGRARDFTNPEQVPPPLNTTNMRASPLPSGPATAPPAERGPFQPRSTSASSGSPAPEAVQIPAKVEKALPTPPFIRPSDIYKRMAAEQEKERKNSMESSGRPSMESLQRDSDSPAPPFTGRQQRPLSSVDEGPDSPDASQQQQSASAPEDFGEADHSRNPILPPLQGVSGFGSDSFYPKQSEDDKQTPTSSTKATQSATTTSNPSLQTTPTATRALPMSEQQLSPQVYRPPDSLSHQPSQGYRSMVNTAFDHADQKSTTSSQDPNVSRSNTTSTGGVSPIMSHVQPVTTAQMRQQALLDRNAEVPTIAEEPQGRSSQDGFQVPRKPSPWYSQGGSSEGAPVAAAAAAAGMVGVGAAAAGVTQGYRRSLDPPSNDNSPARSPGLENTSSRRLSQGLAAETLTAEAPAVPDQGVEMMPNLEPGETPASEVNEPEATSALPTVGRARAGTDYSMREEDLANAVNASPEPSYSSEAAAAEQSNQNLFLRTQADTPTIPTSTIESPTTAAGETSPAKAGRVRELADKYQEIDHDSQASVGGPSAKSSWSNFHGSQENLSRPVGTRHSTEESNLVSESDYDKFEREGTDWEQHASHEPQPEQEPERELEQEPESEPERPEMQREESFRPQLPGQWVSFQGSAASPAEGLRPSAQQDLSTPRASYEQQPEVDLTPTTRKVPLAATQESEQSTQFAQVKDAGTALGAALIASVGLGHQTRDFGSSGPAPSVDQPEKKYSTGDQGYLQTPARPWLGRGDTDASTATDTSTISASSSVPPTPPPKDTPLLQSAGEGGHYFSGVPLRTARSRDGSPALTQDWTQSGSVPSSGNGDTDSLRKEIERSLDSEQSAGLQDPEAVEEDRERTQDALDAPDNAQSVTEGKDALPPAEMGGARPGLLAQRFSWEKSDISLGTTAGIASAVGIAGAATAVAVETHSRPTPTVQEPEGSPEIKPEMPYERPRSRGLHIMNADNDSSDDEATKASQAVEEPVTHNLPLGAAAGAAAIASVAGVASVAAVAGATGSLGTPSTGPVSPMTKSQENLHARTMSDGERMSGEGMKELAPSPLSEDHGNDDSAARLPSYYFQDLGGLELDRDASAPQVYDNDDEEDDTVGPADAVPSEASGPQVLEDEDEDTVGPAREAPPPISKSAPSPTSPTGKQKIPPFREILAIKSPADRIKSYDETRQTFADMNTGLSDWLSHMLANNPEHANLSTPYSQPPIGAFPKSHKHNPSLAKLTKGFNVPQRSSTQLAGSPMSPEKISNSPGPNVDMDKLQQRGKDLMKGAGVLGGKAQAGAKGLLAKGRSRFGSRREGGAEGGSKATSSSSSTPAPANSNSVLAPISTDRSLPAGLAIPAAHSSRGSSPGFVIPPSRSQSQTPSSLSAASGVLSRTLSRLRDRSRSKSSRRSSRPTSLVLTHPDLLVEDPQSESSRTGDENGSDGADATISPWQGQEGIFLAREVQVERASTGARLGVLPSPTERSFSIRPDSPPETAGRAVEDLPALYASDDQQQAQIEDQDGDTAGQKRSGDTIRKTPTTPQTAVFDERKREENENEDEGDPYDATPVAVTALASRDEEHDELYDTTPTGLKKFPRGSQEYDDEKDKLDDSAIRDGEKEQVLSGDAVERDVQGEQGTHETENSTAVTEEDSITEPDEDAATLTKARMAELGIAAATADRDTRDISRQFTAKESDRVSEISAQDHSETAEEGTEQDSSNKTPSRRSSVSSLGHHGQSAESEQEEPIMSSQAQPAGPIGHVAPLPNDEVPPVVAPGGSAQEPSFTRRLNRRRPPPAERPLSYMPLARDSSGALIQESLDTANDGETNSKGLNAASESNAATSLCRALLPEPHPQIPATETDGANAEIYVHPSPVGRRAPFRQIRSRNDNTADRKSNRLSGFLGGANQPSSAPVTGPSAGNIPDNYGLEGLHDDLSSVTSGDGLPVQEEQQDKRRSSMWESFKRSPAASKPELSKENVSRRADPVVSENNNPTVEARGNNSSATVLDKQPQRATTSATQPEPKKNKRLSGLGSLFGRSSTTGHKVLEKKKPSKGQTPIMDDSQRQAPAQSGRIGKHDNPAAMNRQQFLEWKHGSQGYPQPQPRTNATYPQPVNAVRPVPQPPPGGWYAPQGMDQPAPSQTPFRSPPQSPQWPLRDEWLGHQIPRSHVPVAFQPVESSYNRPPVPIGPPEARQSPATYPPPTAPIRSIRSTRPANGQRYPMQASPEQQYKPLPPLPRQNSHGSNENQLSPQVSGQSEWQRSGWSTRGSLPSIMPTQSRSDSDGGPSGHESSIGSITEEVARSPAREYPDQQTPWAITLPLGGSASQNSRQSSLPTTGYQQVADPRMYHSGQGSEELRRSQISSVGTQRSPSSSTAPAPAPARESRREARNPGDNAYPSPPYTPPMPSNSSPPQRGTSYAQPRPIRGSRDYQSAIHRIPEGELSTATQGTYAQLQPDYSDGQNDSAEQAPEMRGVSYPGQEWVPSFAYAHD